MRRAYPPTCGLAFLCRAADPACPAPSSIPRLCAPWTREEHGRGRPPRRTGGTGLETTPSAVPVRVTLADKLALALTAAWRLSSISEAIPARDHDDGRTRETLGRELPMTLINQPPTSRVLREAARKGSGFLDPSSCEPGQARRRCFSSTRGRSVMELYPRTQDALAGRSSDPGRALEARSPHAHRDHGRGNLRPSRQRSERPDFLSVTRSAVWWAFEWHAGSRAGRAARLRRVLATLPPRARLLRARARAERRARISGAAELRPCRVRDDAAAPIDRAPCRPSCGFSRRAGATCACRRRAALEPARTGACASTRCRAATATCCSAPTPRARRTA